MFPRENGVYCVLPTEYTERPPNTGSPPRLFCTTHPLKPPPSASAAPKTVGWLTLASIQSSQDQDSIYAPRKTHVLHSTFHKFALSASSAFYMVGRPALASIQSSRDQDSIYVPGKTCMCSTPPSTSLPSKCSAQPLGLHKCEGRGMSPLFSSDTIDCGPYAQLTSLPGGCNGLSLGPAVSIKLDHG